MLLAFKLWKACGQRHSFPRPQGDQKISEERKKSLSGGERNVPTLWATSVCDNWAPGSFSPCLFFPPGTMTPAPRMPPGCDSNSVCAASYRAKEFRSLGPSPEALQWPPMPYKCLCPRSLKENRDNTELSVRLVKLFPPKNAVANGSGA